MKKYLFALAFLWPAAAWAACSSPIAMLDGGGSTVNMDASAGSGANCAAQQQLVQGGAVVATANALFVQPGSGSTWAATQSGTWTVQPGNTANTTAWLVTGTGGTFPATQGTNPWIVSGSGTAGSAASGVVTVQGIASMTKLLVTPDANSAVNVAQINGVTPLMGNGVTGTGSPRVTIASDNTAIAAAGQVATGAAPPTGATYIGTLQSGATGGHVAAPIMCDNHVFKHITSATDTNAVTGVTSQVIYICSWRSRAAGVATWYLESSNNTSGTCGSPTQLTGVATEAANTGETWGGSFWSGLKVASANGLCINSTGTGGVDVDIWYAQF